MVLTATCMLTQTPKPLSRPGVFSELDALLSPHSKAEKSNSLSPNSLLSFCVPCLGNGTIQITTLESQRPCFFSPSSNWSPGPNNSTFLADLSTPVPTAISSVQTPNIYLLPEVLFWCFLSPAFYATTRILCKTCIWSRHFRA